MSAIRLCYDETAACFLVQAMDYTRTFDAADFESLPKW